MPVVRFEAVKSLGFAGISGVYALVGKSNHNLRGIHFINNTDGDMFFSFDAINDNLFVPAGGFAVYDIATNSTSSIGASDLLFELFTQFYVKQSTAPTKGAVYVMGFYGRSNT